MSADMFSLAQTCKEGGAISGSLTRSQGQVEKVSAHVVPLLLRSDEPRPAIVSVETSCILLLSTNSRS